MGTTKPLTICIHPDLIGQSWVSDLVTAGHTVTDNDMEVWGADLVLGPTCARFLPGMEFAIEALIKGARAIRYKGKKGD